MRRLPHLIIASLIAVVLFSFYGHSVGATGCTGGSFSWKTGKTPDAQGRLHVSVNYSGGPTAPTATVKGLMEDAVAAWNVYSCKTGIGLDATTSSGDLEFFYTTNETLTLSCAAYSTDTDRIYHGPIFQSRVSNMSATQARAIFEHELGHFLGLNEHSGSPANIMNQIASCSSFHPVPFIMQIGRAHV